MKWMKKLRLINWHYFEDETMEFGKQTLITGKNAAGKSTIIDALQVLFIANQRMIKFNPAAHEDAKRTLVDYLKGKIGSDERAYVRDGDFVSYLIAEFEDKEKRESFVIGMVADVYYNLDHHEEFFILAPMTLEKLELMKPDGKLRNRDEFRRYYNGGSNGIKSVFEQNKSEYQKALLTRMGQVHDRFFQTFTRALSFKPIQNIRDFVYQNILDKRELQLDLMKENFEVHERYRLELQELQKRKGKLVQIREKFQTTERLRQTVTEQDYVIRCLRACKEQETLEDINGLLNQLEAKLERARQDLELAEQKRTEATREKADASRRLYENTEERRKNELDQEIERYTGQKSGLENELHTWQHTMNKQAELLGRLAAWEGNEIWIWPKGEQQKLNQAADFVSGLASDQILLDHDVAKEQVQLHDVGSVLANIHDRMAEERTRSTDRLRNLDQKISQTETTIRDLENRKRPYRQELLALKSLLEERLGARSAVWIFCEEMELTDEAWRNAIEGYLNTQRFDLLVEPSMFREALAIYEREKRGHRIEGIGLVNTEAEQIYLNTAEKGSLAESAIAPHSVIQAHLEHLLGKVMKASDELELLRHRTAVTASCMAYSNLVARQIPERQYALPYIGSHAIVRQLELQRAEFKQLKEERSRLNTNLEQIRSLLEQLKDKSSLYGSLSVKLELPQLVLRCQEELLRLQEERDRIDLSEADRLRETIATWEQTEKKWNDQWGELNKAIGSQEREQSELTARRYVQANLVRDAAANVEQWTSQWPERLQQALVRLEEAERSSAATTAKIVNWEGNRKGNETTLNKEIQLLEQQRVEYNTEYTFIADVQANHNQKYDRLLEQIDHLDIPEYQLKVDAAIQVSEEEFKSHFVFKLREAIEMARREFRELNYALEHFPFSSDKYHFQVVPSEKYRRFYDAVMDPRLMERGSLFEVMDDERIEVLHELFERLVRGDAEDMDEFTDYRRYLDYDILVKQGESQYRFSQVLKEKSGGETQTPFYVAILASFYHLYRSERTFRIVVFDEAFNKMDEQRIKTSLKLIKRMNLQLIAAVPDEKMQHMAPEVTTTLIVTNQNFRCFVDMIDRWEEVEQVQFLPEESGEEWRQEKLF